VAAKTVAEGPFVLVTDLGMPASGGASFHGGFEVVKRLWKMNLRPPVLMMDREPQPVARCARARWGSSRSSSSRPSASSNTPQFEADLSAFAAEARGQRPPRLARPRRCPRPAFEEEGGGSGRPAGGAPAADAARPFEFLSGTWWSCAGADANAITALVMKVAGSSSRGRSSSW